MPKFRITVANKDFNSTSEIAAVDANAAHSRAIRGALEIGLDEICAGEPLFAAQVSIEHDGAMVDKQVIAIGSSPMSTSD